MTKIKNLVSVDVAINEFFFFGSFATSTIFTKKITVETKLV